jgi:hypothetical protein
MKTQLFAATLIAVAGFGFNAHADEDNDATITGLAGGAATGAVVGGPVGAVVGGAVGATTGAAVDDANKDDEIIIKKRQPAPTVVIEE